ncbi:MAG: tRNA lysidine(34) synthetase TilS [candidate division Zixibacteria bacterium]|nr:tRNA lysidine(34) synthetase TilS [candidate division Zixibacteria bacterium]
MTDMLKQIKENIAQKQMVSAGDKILVSFSGGPDSTALLYSLYKLKKEFKTEITACYINHYIRPKDVKKEIKFCHEFCNKLNIPFIVVEANIPKYAKEQKLSLEEAGRNFRKNVLQKIAIDNDCNKIAVGHHLDDTIETILFRLFRGTGPGGLNPIKPISGLYIRPLYNIPKGDIVAFLKNNNIKFVIDKSNLESDFSRNYIRNKVIPVIEKHFGKKIKGSINKFSQILADEDYFLKNLAQKEAKKLCTITSGGKIIVDLKKISVYDTAIRRRIIKLLLEKLFKHPGGGSFNQIERINDLINGRQKAVNLGKNLRVIKDRDNLILSGKKVNLGKQNLTIPGTIELPDIKTAVKTCLIENKSDDKAKKVRQKGGWKINIDYDRVSLPLEINGIKPGDKFRPLGLGGTKKVGDYLTDKKCLRQTRDEIAVVRDKKGIVWLVGYEITDRVKINNKTKKVLEIELIRRKNADRYPQI